MSTPATPDPDLAQPIAGADWRLKVLERLVVMGMGVAEDIEQRAIQQRDSRHCLGKGFAAAARAVRLTLVLHASTEADILAMRKGVFPAFLTTPEGARAAAEAKPPVGRVRRLVHDAVRHAIDREVGEAETAREAREALYERLIESEDYTALLHLPFRDCVNAICDDLGLAFDWRRQTAVAGFAAPDRANLSSDTTASILPPPPSSRAKREARRPGTQTGLSGKCALGPGSTFPPARGQGPLRPG